MDSTGYALTILNYTQFGEETDYVNNDIIEHWGPTREREFCDDYLMSIGDRKLQPWEEEMIKYLNLKEE